MEVEGAESAPERKMEKTAYDKLEETRTSMEEIVAKMLFIKKEGRPKSELRELVTHISLFFINLRQVNRSILLEEDRVKAETESAKAPVDFTTLQLHNLMYEKNHYLKAIKACKDFKSKHPDIDLVPEEEFFSSAPEEIKGNAVANDNAHELMLKRLNFELFQRKELCKLREKLEQHRKGLQDTIANRKKFLSSLPSHLKSLKKASLPVQQQLGILHTKKLKQHHSAELLPPPLYVIYSQLLAQKEAFGENIDLEILGSMKDAQAFAHQQAIKDTGAGTNIDNNRLDDDAPDEEDDGQRRRKRPKKVSGRESLDHAGIYQSHPLKIILHIYDDEATDAKPVKLIALRFEYLVKFNVVCVGIEGSHEEPESDILCNLFPDDTGVELPHQTAKLFAGDAISFDEKKTSRPYKWAQHLAGIDFLPEVSPLLTGSGPPPSSETLKGDSVLSGLSLYRQQNRVKTVVQRIRSRKKAQLALMEQLDSLTKLNWPPLTYENVPWAFHTPVCNLRSWLPVRPTTIQASFAVDSEQVPDSLDLHTDGRFGTLREEVECVREDGELPSVTQAPAILNDAKPSPSKGFDLEHSKRLDLISKSMMPSSIGKSQSFKKHESNSELILDSESDLDEPMHTEPETESAPNIGRSEMVDRSWEDHAGREFCMILCRRARNERNAKLEAKIKISMEYPIRPPSFTLSLSNMTPGENSSDAIQGDSVSCEKDGLEWYNELRAMEAEVNLHIIKMLPRENENHILAHQIYCLAMLFDFQMDQTSTFSETQKSTSVIDVGLCEPVSGKILARSFRGRDRRKMISWKNMECNLGYPY